jgi:hypothetical protein
MSTTNAVAIVADKTVFATTSNFFRKNGNYIGGVFNTLWVGLLIYSIYFIYKLDSMEYPAKKYYYVAPVVALLSIFAANVYYIHYVNKNKTSEKLDSSRLVYANVSLVPIYLIIATLLILASFSFKQ